MRTFLTHLKVQFIMDFREKGTLLTFYLVPLVFFFVMGSVFSTINPDVKGTLAASMTIFAVTMGAVLGIPVPLVKMREAGVLRAFRVCGIPGWAILLAQSVSAALHLLVVAVVIYIASPIFFGSTIPDNNLAYLAALIILIFASIGVGLLIGVLARSQASATMLSQAVFLPSLLLAGIMFPASMLPEIFVWLGRLFPATHAMQAFSSMAFGLEQSVLPAVSITAAAAIGILASGLAIWFFNRLSKTV